LLLHHAEPDQQRKQSVQNKVMLEEDLHEVEAEAEACQVVAKWLEMEMTQKTFALYESVVSNVLPMYADHLWFDTLLEFALSWYLQNTQLCN
jgi:hypothetical protein